MKWRRANMPGAIQVRLDLITFRAALLFVFSLSSVNAGAQQAQTIAPLAKTGGFMVPATVVLRATTKAEEEAHAIWTLRAALNVAALQCQYSPFLRTVKNYNEMLRHHAQELRQAQTVMMGHFRRYDRARALNTFDQYTTRTYNSFSTLDAQYSFCEAVGTVGRKVLRLPRNGLAGAAPGFNNEVRQSLYEPPMRILFDASQIASPVLSDIPDIEPERGRDRKRRRI